MLAGMALAAQAPTTNEGQAPARSARPAESKEQIERRLASVSTLIERSSAARQIESSANAQALALRGKAREELLSAEQAYRDGNLPQASGLLDSAAKAFYAGVRLADPWKVTDDKKRRDFDARMDSVKALLKAQRRIRAEKDPKAEENNAGEGVEALIREASGLAANNELDRARTVLDKAYAAVIDSLEGMRKGDTLVRTLHFTSKEDEYRYELDRNDAYQLLANTLMKEKRAQNAGLSNLIQRHMDNATRLRGEAQAQAAKGEFVSAIKLQEDSTRELMRAVRSAGLNLP